MDAAFNAYDPDLYIYTQHSKLEQPIDNTARPNNKPSTQRGYHFKPLELHERDPVISTITSQLAEPVDLFLQFLPEKIVEKWVRYTNEAAKSLAAEDHDFSKSWEPVTLSEVYLFIGIIIYIGLHKEANLKSYWATDEGYKFLPDHPMARLMARKRFFLIFRHLRIYNEDTINPTEAHDPLNFQKVDEWSSFLQEVCLELWKPGLRVAVNECIIGFTGKSKIKITIKNKPTPIGFKAWAIAEE
ncbi:hypothetical protein H9Q72_006695, partial [Fusarium xylarioides]